MCRFFLTQTMKAPSGFGKTTLEYTPTSTDRRKASQYKHHSSPFASQQSHS